MGCAYAAGFGAFVGLMPKPFTTLPPSLEGLAVFTGGAGRVATALRLAQTEFNGPVLISGINPTTSLNAMVEESALPPLNAAQRERIMLDGAASTRENMESLKLWATTADLNHLGIITSTYHAARVKVLGWWVAPQLNLTLLPVQPEDAGLDVLFREYNKLLAAPFLN